MDVSIEGTNILKRYHTGEVEIDNGLLDGVKGIENPFNLEDISW